MIGHAQYRHLTTNLTSPGVPAVNQAWFDRALFARCKCRLAWHRLRRVFVVHRPRGPHARPLTYIDLSAKEWPLTPAILDLTIDAVRWADARASEDLDLMQEVFDRRHQEDWEKKNASFVAERLPDFMADVRRWREVLSDGRRRTKFFDAGGLRKTG